MISNIFDIIIAFSCIFVAFFCLFSRKIISSIIYFISFGIIVSLIWTRLGAYDVAIAEAAIGSGVTGVLMLLSYKKIKANKYTVSLTQKDLTNTFIIFTVTIVTLTSVLVGFALFANPSNQDMVEIIDISMHASGVTNPVTAVLLNFRSFDTLLEITVLLLAGLCVHSLGLSLFDNKVDLSSNFVLMNLSKIVVPVCMLFGGYILWVGSYTPGGAFQAGAVWAGSLVLLRLVQNNFLPLKANLLLCIVGLVVFISAALITFFINDSVLMYPMAVAGNWILLIEATAAISIAFLLYSLFEPPVSQSTTESKKSIHSDGKSS